MTTQSFGSVAVMEFRRPPNMAFADIVEEFDIAFQMVDSRTRALSWDCDDIALIDRDCVRVALGWLPGKAQGQSSHLIVAVGSTPEQDQPEGAPTRVDPASFEFLADRIVERTRDYIPVKAVLRGTASRPVGADLVDTLFELLRVQSSDMPGDIRRPDRDRFAPEFDQYAGGNMADSGDWHDTDAQADAATMTPQPDAVESGHAGRLLLTRARPTKPLRLTIHALALSLCLYVPALGAAMFAYTMMRDVFPVAAQAV